MHAEDEIIAGRLPGDKGQPAHHRQVVTVFGLYGRSSGGAIPVAVVVRLLADLGAEPASVRSSISRLKKKGVLVPADVDGQAGYSLNPDLEEHFRARDERIFHPTPARADDPWLLAAFSVPEAQRNARHRLRNGLARMGFGAVGPGLSVGPLHLRAEAAEFIEAHNLTEYVEFFVSRHDGPGDIRDKVAQWWDLGALEAHYADFIDAYGRLLAEWRDRAERDTADYRDAFRAYIPMFTQWRRLPFLDPGLPESALPDGWKGTTARELFLGLDAALAPLAARYAQRAIHG